MLRRFLVLWLLVVIACNAQAESVVISAFNSGELSPLVSGRIDLEKYYTGCATLENMIVVPHGGVRKRPGTKYIADTETHSEVSRLIPFEFSTTQSYILEFGNKYIRFYRDGGQITSGGSAYSITTPYEESDLFDIHFIQSADTMYLVHPDHEPATLTRTGHTSWTLTDITFTGGPFLAENTTTTTITPSAETGSITLTASSSIWNENHIGAQWQIVHTTDANTASGSFTATGNSSTLTMENGRTFDFSTHGSWTGTVLLQRSYDGSTWKDVTSFVSAADGNVTYSDSESVDDAEYRVRMDSYTSGTCNYTLIARSLDVEGEATVTGYTSGTSVTATVTTDLGGTTATSKWSEGAWSADEGFPATIAFFEERQVYAGTANSPQTIWMSQTDDWDNFEDGSDDTDAITVTLAADQVNVIRWLASKNSLLVGTIGGEWEVSATEATEPISPSNVTARLQSSYGSSTVQPVVTGDNLLFVQRQGEKIRNLSYQFDTDSWIAPDITLLSEHITDSGIVDMGIQRVPYHILWCVRDDGDVAALTMEENNEVIGWHRHTFGGDVESVAVITSSTEDEVWFTVERTIDEDTVRYVEQLQPFDWGDDQKDVFFVDSGITFDGGAAVTVTNITQADPAVVTAAAHGFSDGDQVRFESVGGMTEVNDNVYTVANSTTDTFELQDHEEVGDINSVDFTKYASGGTVEKVENAFTDAEHLAREDIYIAGDGGYGGSYTVNRLGNLTIDDYYNTVHAGIPFTAKLLPVRLESRTSPGRMFAKNKRITDVFIRFNETLDCDVGTSWSLYDGVTFREVTDLLNVAVPLYSGDKSIAIADDYNTDGYIYIQSSLPVPLEVLALRAELEVYE